MFPLENQELLVQDREDLIAILRMRFGDVPAQLIESIYDIEDFNTLQRLILVAANAPEWRVFLEELKEDNESFRLAGERFNPI